MVFSTNQVSFMKYLRTYVVLTFRSSMCMSINMISIKYAIAIPRLLFVYRFENVTLFSSINYSLIHDCQRGRIGWSLNYLLLEEKHSASQNLEFVTLHLQTYLENAFRKLPFWYSRINLTSVTSWKFNWDNPCSLLFSHLHFDGLCTYVVRRSNLGRRLSNQHTVTSWPPKLNNRSADCVERSISLALVAPFTLQMFILMCA